MVCKILHSHITFVFVLPSKVQFRDCFSAQLTKRQSRDPKKMEHKEPKLKWRRVDVQKCSCKLHKESHVHCPCIGCEYKPVSLATELRHWHQHQLVYGSSSVVSSDDNDSVNDENNDDSEKVDFVIREECVEKSQNGELLDQNVISSIIDSDSVNNDYNMEREDKSVQNSNYESHEEMSINGDITNDDERRWVDSRSGNFLQFTKKL